MANNCYNFIRIEGKREEINHFFNMMNDWKIKDDLDGCEIYSNLQHEFGNFGNDAKWFDLDIDFEPEENSEEIKISGDSA